MGYLPKKLVSRISAINNSPIVELEEVVRCCLFFFFAMGLAMNLSESNDGCGKTEHATKAGSHHSSTLRSK